MSSADDLARRLRPHYSDFLRDHELLLTGHSHQAWPNVARRGQLEAYEDAAHYIDDKWGRAAAKADRVRQGVAVRVGANPSDVALAPNTHELTARFLSCLDLRKRPHLVTTQGEFHSLHRQLQRLQEEGVVVTFVPPAPVDTLAARLVAAITKDTAAVLASTVLFETATVVPDLDTVVTAAHAHGALALLDAYHAFNIVPFRIGDFGPAPVFVVAGGYKYAQWGEGACFMCIPAGSEHRPVFTGWFSDYAHLAEPRGEGPVRYGATGAERFAGSTYDPTSHYRAAAVLDFFDAQGLDVATLRAASLEHTGQLLEGFRGYDVATPAAPEARGGFVSVRLGNASAVSEALREKGIFTDARGSLLRFGPAPYLTSDDIERGLRAFREVAPR